MPRILWGFHIVVGIYNIFSLKPHLCNETEGITAGRRLSVAPQPAVRSPPSTVRILEPPTQWRCDPKPRTR